MKTIFVEFKSNPIFYEREKRGIKNNTIRKYENSDERFETLKKASEKDLRGTGEHAVRIINSENGEFFERSIKDVSIYENLYIITWDCEV